MENLENLQTNSLQNLVVTKESLLKKANDILDTNISTIQGEPLTKQALSLALLKNVPFLSGFLRSVDGIGGTASKLAQLKGGASAKSAASVFSIGGIVLSTIDFIRIPLIYGACWSLGVKPPITLSKNARWAYSGILLALGITALAAPATAPVIALTSAGIGLGVSIFTFGKYFYDRYQQKKELVLTQEKIGEEIKRLEQIKKDSEELIKRLKEDQSGELTKLQDESDILSDNFSQHKEILQNLKNKELHVQQKLNKIGWTAGLGKGVAVGLGSIALVGLILTPLFPPVGLSIIAASAVAGGLFFLGSLGATILGKIFKSRQKAEESEDFKSIREKGTHSDELNQNLTTTLSSVESNLHDPVSEPDISSKWQKVFDKENTNLKDNIEPTPSKLPEHDLDYELEMKLEEMKKALLAQPVRLKPNDRSQTLDGLDDLEPQNLPPDPKI